MAIAYTIRPEYAFTLYHGAVNSVFIAPENMSLTSRNINPESLLSFVKRQEVSPAPEADGGLIVTDGKANADPMLFYGQQADSNQSSHDLFYNMGIRISQIANMTGIAYLYASLYDGSSTFAYRRYGLPRSVNTIIRRRTLYSLQDLEMVFDVVDPWWYRDAVQLDTVSVVAGTGAKVTTDTGNRRTQRLFAYVTKTGGSNPTNVTLSNSAGNTLSIAGSLANVNDFWAIDMYAGTVQKSVSGVVSNDIANASGRFWRLAAGTDTVTVTDTAGATFTVSLFWLERIV